MTGERANGCLEALALQSLGAGEYKAIIYNNDPEGSPPAGVSFPDGFKVLMRLLLGDMQLEIKG